MTDANNNGILETEEITFHLRSAVVGAIVGIFGGGVLLSLLVYYIPNAVGLVTIFSGSVCKPIETQFAKCREGISCFEAGAIANGIDYEFCRSKYIRKEDEE